MLSPNVIRLGWVSLFADISSEMLYPIIPIFLTGVIGAPISSIGFIEGCAEAIASFLKVVSGRLSDLKGRRRPFVFWGYILSAMAKPLIALAGSWTFILIIRSIDRVGKGLRSSPRDALLADSVSAESRGFAFGFHRGMDTIGAVLGPFFALALITFFHGNLRWVFVVAFIPGIIGALLVLTVKEVRKNNQLHNQQNEVKNKIGMMKIRHFPRQFKIYLFAWCLFSITNSSDMFILLKAKEVGFSTTNTILLYCFYNFMYASASPWLGQWSDQIGRKKILVLGLFVFAFVYIGLAISTERWQVWSFFGIYGLYIAATDGIGKAFAVDLVPSYLRGSAIGLLGAWTGFSTLIASSMAGLLWSHLGSWAAFIYGAVGALIAAAVIGFGVLMHIQQKS